MNQPVNLVIFHYHLLPGGVTDVVRLSLQAFNPGPSVGKITIVCGRDENLDSLREYAADPERDIEVRVYPAIDYLSQRDSPPDEPAVLAGKLEREFGSEQSVWLIHNYHLGKNWIFTAALLQLAEKGDQKMIFQVHDFPECGRYENLKILRDNLKKSLYTGSLSVRYSVINQRDYDLMIQAGLPENQIFLLENPLPFKPAAPLPSPEERAVLIENLSRYAPDHGSFLPQGELWLYPVRTIRRKNILEGGLICRLLDSPANLIVTLPGISEQEKEYSETVERAFLEGLIPGFWGTGILPEESGITYQGMIRHADRIFSSSVQEGFGYMYLNAILWNKPLIARYLDIMGGFLPLFETYPSHFYRQVKVPGKKQLKQSLREEYILRFDALNPGPSAALKEKLIGELDALLNQEGIDFSFLSVLDQYSSLQTQKEDKGYRKELKELNHSLIRSITSMEKVEKDSHREELFRHYGFDAYNSAFQKILDSFQDGRTFSLNRDPGETLLRDFTRLEYLRLLYS